MESSCTRFTAAEGGARLAACAGSKNILVTEHTAFISTSVLIEHAYKIRGLLSSGCQRSVYITRPSRIECVSHELTILTDLSVIKALGFDDVGDWKQELEVKEVLVCTAEVLKRILHEQIIQISDINVLIIDSCHLIFKDENLQYIMKLYKQCESFKPRILALTYPLFTAPKDINDQTDKNRDNVRDTANKNDEKDTKNEVCEENDTKDDIDEGIDVKDNSCDEENDSKDILSDNQRTKDRDKESLPKDNRKFDEVKPGKDTRDDIEDINKMIDKITENEYTKDEKNAAKDAECKEVDSKVMEKLIDYDKNNGKDNKDINSENVCEDIAAVKDIDNREIKDNLDDFDLYEKLEWKIEELEKELCCDMDLAEDIDGGKRLSATLTKPKELIIEFSPKLPLESLPETYTDLERYMRCTVNAALDFINEHRYDPTEIYGEDMYEEFANIPDPTAEPKHILKEFLYVLDQLGPYAADKAAFSLLIKLEKLKIKVPYERHFLLLCLCTSVFVKIRCYTDTIFSRYISDWEKITAFSTPKVLRLAEILEQFQPPENLKEIDSKNGVDSTRSKIDSTVDKSGNTTIDQTSGKNVINNVLTDINTVDSKNILCSDENKINMDNSNDKGMKRSKTNELLSAIEKCDFITLGNKIEDRVNTYEANLKDLDEFDCAVERSTVTNLNEDGSESKTDSKVIVSQDDKIVTQCSVPVDITKDNTDSSNVNLDYVLNNSSNTVNSSANEDTKNIIDSVQKDSGISIDSNKIGVGKRPGHRTRGRGRVQRSNATKIQQLQQNPDALCGIIFVKEALMAKIMFMMIVDMTRCRPSLSHLCAQYCASEGEGRDCQKEGKKQEEVLKKFRMHECNLLLATSVLEEGIDLPRCNLVVRWDVPPSYRSHGLCRGRARAPRASVALLASSDAHSEALLHNLAVYKELDQIITRKCGCGIQFEPPQEEENHADSLANVVKPYTPVIITQNDGSNDVRYDDTRKKNSNDETFGITSENVKEVNKADKEIDVTDVSEEICSNLCNKKTDNAIISNINKDIETNNTLEENSNSSNFKSDIIDNTNKVLNRLTNIPHNENTVAKLNRLSKLDKDMLNITELNKVDLSTKDSNPNLNIFSESVLTIDTSKNNDNELKLDEMISSMRHEKDRSDEIIDESEKNDDEIEQTKNISDDVENGEKCATEINSQSVENINKNAQKTVSENLENNTKCSVNHENVTEETNVSDKNVGFTHKENSLNNKNLDLKEVFEVLDIDKDLDDESLNLIGDKDIRGAEYNVKYENIKFEYKLSDNKKEESVASVDLNTAIALINRYCGKLPSDTFTRLAPQWWMEQVRLPGRQGELRTAYICTLRMPLNCPVKYNIVGHPMPTRVLARRMVALQACRILHKSGELDNQLMPIGKENFKAAELENSVTCNEPADTSDCARPGTTKRRQYYFKRTAWAFTDCQAIIDATDSEIENKPTLEIPIDTTASNGGSNILYAIVSRLWCALPERYNTRGRRLHAPQHAPQAIGVLMARREPTQLQIPAFPVYTRSGEVRVSVEPALRADVRLSPRRARLIRRFMRFVFSDVLRVRRRGMKLQTEGTTHNNYYIVPTVKKSRWDGTSWIDVDWPFLELIYKHTEEKKILEVEKPMLWEQDDKKREKEKESKVKKIENPLLKHGEVFTFDAEKYKEAVVTPWYRNQDQPQFFLVAEICWKLSPDSAFPSAQHDSFRSYYRAKYGAELTQSCQPLLDVDHTSARLNLLTPRYVNRKGVALPVSSERTRRAKRDRLDQKQILVPELCRVHPFAAPLWFATVALPCVLYRINALLIADEIRRAVAIDVGLGIPRIDDETCPGFQWPPLDFGWSLAEVLSADSEKIEKKKDEEQTKPEEKDEELKEDDKQGELEAEEKGEEKEKTINDILQEKLDAENGFEIGTWSNDMASAIPPYEYDEYLEPLPSNLTFCTSSSGGTNWSDPIEKPKGQFNPSRAYSMADSDCSYVSSDFDTDDSDLTDCSDDDTDTTGFCSSRNSNVAMGVRIEYKTAHEAEAVDLERRQPIAPAPQPDKLDDERDVAEYSRVLRAGVPPREYVNNFRKSVAKHKKEIKENGNLISKDKPIVDLLPEPFKDMDKNVNASFREKVGDQKKVNENPIKNIVNVKENATFCSKHSDLSEINLILKDRLQCEASVKDKVNSVTQKDLNQILENTTEIDSISETDRENSTLEIVSQCNASDDEKKISFSCTENGKKLDKNSEKCCLNKNIEVHEDKQNENLKIHENKETDKVESIDNKILHNTVKIIDKECITEVKNKTKTTDDFKNKINEMFPYKNGKDLETEEITLEAIEKNKRYLLAELKKTMPDTEIKKLNCFSMKDIDIDSPEYVNEKVVNIGFDSKEKYQEKVNSWSDVHEYKPYYMESKAQNGKEFDFDYQPDLKGHPGPSPSVILQALTMSNANDGINLERLETIGDSFLKFAITAYLYCAHPAVHEGKLSHMRSKQVSNLNLYRLGRNKRLGARMIASKFEPHDNWLPPCHKPPPTLQPTLTGDNKEPMQNQDAPVDSAGCFIPYNLITQHSIPDKSIADCVEALIGAYLLECGPRGALLFMSWLGIRVLPRHTLPLPDNHPYVTRAQIEKEEEIRTVQKPVTPKPVEPLSSDSCCSDDEETDPELSAPEPDWGWPGRPVGALRPHRDKDGRWMQKPVTPKPVEPLSSDSCCSDDEETDPELSAPEPDWGWPGRPVGALRPHRDKDRRWMQSIFGELKAPPSPLLRYIEDPDGELEQMLSGYDALERTLQYRFRDRSLLLQALTHASHQKNRLTDCYQRLEFLGDAILDYLITRHLYEDPRRHSPGALTDLRSALVNNTIFATLAARHGFHKYFRHMSPGLNDVLTKYVKIQEENGHSISEEHYLIQEDEMEQAEDVEVPKALGDLFESVAGAIFLDSGMSLGAVWRAVGGLLGAELDAFSAAAPKSPVRELLEAEPDTAKFGKPERLADGRRVRVCVEVFGRGAFKGIGRNYRIAKGTAARCALRHLRTHRPR